MPDHIVSIRVRALSGVAACSVCATWSSWRLPWADREQLEEQVDRLRCPSCGGGSEPLLELVCMVVDVNGERQVWPVEAEAE